MIFYELEATIGKKPEQYSHKLKLLLQLSINSKVLDVHIIQYIQTLKNYISGKIWNPSLCMT